jgi:hypothetical protein
MWYPSQQQQSCYEYTRHYASQQQQQQQQTYSRTAYYCNGDELSTTCVATINDENESSIQHCQTTYSSNVHGKIKMRLKSERSRFFSRAILFYI